MAAGFRKSFLGYNCDDVLNYIERTSRENNEKEIEYREKITELEENNRELMNVNSDITSRVAELEAKLGEFEAKSEEIRALSEGIGRLYLVSKSNAQAIMDSANEASRATISEVTARLEAITNTQAGLEDICRGVQSESDTFVNNVCEFSASLSALKLELEKNNEEITKHNEEFYSVISEI